VTLNIPLFCIPPWVPFPPAEGCPFLKHLSPLDISSLPPPSVCFFLDSNDLQSSRSLRLFCGGMLPVSRQMDNYPLARLPRYSAAHVSFLPFDWRRPFFLTRPVFSSPWLPFRIPTPLKRAKSHYIVPISRCICRSFFLRRFSV